MPDFFGNETSLEETQNALTGGVLRPARTAEQLAEEERQRIAANYARGLDANGNPLPAYGTPASQGGTAQGYQVTQPAVGTTNLTRSTADRTVRNAPVQTLQRGDLNHNGVFQPGLVGQGAGTVARDMAIAQGLADEVLASRPTVDPNNQVTKANVDALAPVVDPNLARNAEIDRAFAMSEDLVNRARLPTRFCRNSSPLVGPAQAVLVPSRAVSKRPSGQRLNSRRRRPRRLSKSSRPGPARPLARPTSTLVWRLERLTETCALPRPTRAQPCRS
jgi:hypothetical protein